MYTILIKDDNTTIATQRSNIMHRSSLVNEFRILVNPIWNGLSKPMDMRNFTCVMEFRLPNSTTYIPEVLTLSEELFEDKLEYKLPINTKLTSEVGNVEYKFIFTYLEMNDKGQFLEHSRKTTSNVLTVIPVEQWNEYVADSNLDSIVQILMTNQSQIEQNKLYAQMVMATKADSIKYDKETNELSLMGNNQKLDSVTLEDCECEDGVPIVDFTTVEPEGSLELDNVVEF